MLFFLSYAFFCFFVAVFVSVWLAVGKAVVWTSFQFIWNVLALSSNA
jgi:MFS superfamily sulfate permease-like transporter